MIHRLRFSVRAMMLATAGFAVALGILHYRARQQALAVAWIQDGRGSVHYIHEMTTGVWDANAAPPVPSWIVKRLGPHYFYRIQEVLLSELPTTTTDAKHLRHLYGVQRIAVSRAHLTALHVHELRRLTKLQKLHLSKTSLEEGAFASLPHVPALTDLLLAHTQVSAQDMETVLRLRRIEFLSLVGSEITLPESYSWSQMQRLKQLHLDSVIAPSDGLFHQLDQLPSLRVLLLSQNPSNEVQAAFVREASRRNPNLSIHMMKPPRYRWNPRTREWVDQDDRPAVKRKAPG